MLDKKTKVNKTRFLSAKMVVACNVDGGDFCTTRRAEQEAKAEMSADKPKKAISLHDCMQRFLAAEVLSEGDAWFCSGCKNHVQAEKQIGLWKLPPVLIIHLKRFAFLSNRYREKLEELVEYPLEGLDMSPYLLPGAPEAGRVAFDLFAVSNHMGGLGGGHYTAFARPGENWWLFNDEATSVVENSSRIVSPNSYILYYRRRQK
jgi:ubiquitin C-terminal hydrolase